MQKLHRCHYTGNKYDLLQATHRYNNISDLQQVMIVEPTAQKIAVPENNFQGQHQSNVFIEPTTGSSLEYSYTIKIPT